MKKHTNFEAVKYTNKTDWGGMFIATAFGLGIAVIIIELVFGDMITAWLYA